MHRLRQHSTGHSFDVQVFYGDKSVAIDDTARNFVVKVIPLILDVSELSLEQLHGLASAVRFLVGSTSETALRYPEFLLFFLVESRIVYLSTIIKRCKSGKPNVNSYSFRGCWQRSRFALNREDHKPSASLTLDRNCLNLALDRAMQLNLYIANSLSINEFVNQLAPITVGRESERIVSLIRFESWETWFLAFFDSRKECAESLIQSAKNILAARKVINPDKSIGSQLLQPIGLIVVVDRLLLVLPCVNSFLKRLVVEIASRTQLSIQRLSLLGVWIYAIFERLAHLLSLLIFDVLLNSRCGYRAYTSCKIAPAPQGRNSTAEPRKLTTKDAARVSLQPIHNLCHSVSRVVLKEKMNMIRHHFHCMNDKTSLLGLFQQKRFQPFIDSVDKNLATILWAPNQMHFQTKYRARVLGISFHVFQYTSDGDILSRKDDAIPLPPKVGSPLAQNLWQQSRRTRTHRPDHVW
jgi:hypothetical protein